MPYYYATNPKEEESIRRAKESPDQTFGSILKQTTGVGRLYGAAEDIAKGLEPDTDLLRQSGEGALGLGQRGASGFDAAAWDLAHEREGIRDRAHGQNLVSTEQLRQGLQQNLSGQRSLAAGAAPQNQALAARTAAMQMGRLGSGFAGQQALAGAQESRDAQALLMQGLMDQRAQELQAALGGYGVASGAGGSISGTPTANQILFKGAAAGADALFKNAGKAAGAA